MKKLILVPFISLVLCAQTDPITDKIRYELAAAQRDYLLAQTQMDQATNKLRAKMAEADKACGESGKQFDLTSFMCSDKPK